MEDDLLNLPSAPTTLVVSGRRFDADEIALVRSLSDRFRHLSRNELALTVCELLDWVRPSGRPKNRECLDLFDRLEEAGVCRFPAVKQTRPRGTSAPPTAVPQRFGDEAIAGALKTLMPVALEHVCAPEKHRLWRELVGRFHYLGFKTAFGASMRFLINDRNGRNVGCLQYSSPAWRMRVRDEWIGWSDDIRRVNLQKIVSQSRFLILPWVQVPHLGSHVLAKSLKQLPALWRRQFGISPLLVETLVDASRYRGTCYRAANWIYVGETSGRGRMDRAHERHGAEVKRLFVYPLVRDVGKRLTRIDVPAAATHPVRDQAR